jgi:hypothetical protein
VVAIVVALGDWWSWVQIPPPRPIPELKAGPSAGRDRLDLPRVATNLDDPEPSDDQAANGESDECRPDIDVVWKSGATARIHVHNRPHGEQPKRTDRHQEKSLGQPHHVIV